MDIQVKGGVIDTAAYSEGSELEGPADSAIYSTVEELFDLVSEAIEQEAAQINIEYDASLGYPVSGDIDYDRSIADEERGFTVSAFSRG